MFVCYFTYLSIHIYLLIPLTSLKVDTNWKKNSTKYNYKLHLNHTLATHMGS